MPPRRSLLPALALLPLLGCSGPEEVPVAPLDEAPAEAAEVEDGLLLNGGFERSDQAGLPLDWELLEEVGGWMIVDGEASVEGTHSLRWGTQAPVGGAFRLASAPLGHGALPAGSYALSGAYRGLGPAAEAPALVVLFADGDERVGMLPAPVGDGSWQQFVWGFEVDEEQGAGVRLVLEVGAGSGDATRVWFDAIEVSAIED